MDNPWLPVIVALTVAFFGNVVALLGWWSQRGKRKADMAEILTGSALDMVKRWEKRVKELEKKVDCQGEEIRELKARVGVLEEENFDLAAGAKRLVRQVEREGLVPDWKPGPV